MKNIKIERAKGSIYLFCAFTLAGTSVISAHFLTSKLGTFTITATSMLFAILLLFPYCRNKLIKSLSLMEARDWYFLLLQAFCGIFLFRMFLLLGLLHTSAGEAGILIGATPAVTALFARVVLKEAVNKKNLIGILSTIGGILLIQGILLPGSKFALEHFLGNTLVLCAAISESLFNISSRINNLKVISYGKQPLDPVIQTILVSGIAFMLCIIPSIFENPVLSLMSLSIKEWLSLAWYGFFVTALAFIFWYAGIKRSRAYTAAAFSGLMPLTSLILSVIVLGESAGWQQWSGVALIILGILLIGDGQVNNSTSK